MKCPRQGCDGYVTVVYDNPEYIEYLVDEIDELGDVVTHGDMYDLEFGDRSYYYCTTEAHMLSVQEVLDNDGN